MKKISKNPDELLKIPEYQPEDLLFDHEDLIINLIQFLMTPTVVSIVYHTLRTSCGIDSPISDHNDHLTMNILILISKFIEEDKKDSPEKPIKITEINYNSLHDLINKMKSLVYNYDSEKNLIEDTLDQSNFVSLLKMKFSSNNLPPKSFIDILSNKGKIGQELLNQKSLHVHLCLVERKKMQSKQQQLKKST